MRALLHAVYIKIVLLAKAASQEKLELRGDRGSSQAPAGPAAPRTARHGWAHQTEHGWRPIAL